MAAQGIKSNALCVSYTAVWEVIPLIIHSTAEYSRQETLKSVFKNHNTAVQLTKFHVRTAAGYSRRIEEDYADAFFFTL